MSVEFTIRSDYEIKSQKKDGKVLKRQKNETKKTKNSINLMQRQTNALSV